MWGIRKFGDTIDVIESIDFMVFLLFEREYKHLFIGCTLGTPRLFYTRYCLHGYVWHKMNTNKYDAI